MIEILYSPEDVGKEVINGHGKMAKIRKYHMTDKEKGICRDRWKESIIGVDKRIVKKAGKYFFNPYRKGIYYYQLQSMFLLGANEWHSLNNIIKKMEEIMSEVVLRQDGMKITVWDKFKNKTSREDAIKCKSHVGRVQENMVFFQRLTKFHPYGYKLRQVNSAVDIKRTTRKGFTNGCYHYRLSTYNSAEKALPIRDYSEFTFPQHERKYVSYKFIGTVVTIDKIIIKGEVHEVSQMPSG